MRILHVDEGDLDSEPFGSNVQKSAVAIPACFGSASVGFGTGGGDNVKECSKMSGSTILPHSWLQ